MRFIVIPLLLALLFAGQADAFAVKNSSLQSQRNTVRRTDSKTDNLSRHQQIAQNGKTGPEAKHHTNREEVPGKHKEGAWFQRPAHKPKAQEKKKKNAPGGREWAFGKVSWW